jgi:hypothetical protein
MVLAAAALGCGGGSHSRTLEDGAGTAREPNAASTASATSPASSAPAGGDTPPPSAADAGAQPGDCWQVTEGCRCATEGQVVACKGQVLNFGDYVSCAGVRECVNGTWGACESTNFVLTHR